MGWFQRAGAAAAIAALLGTGIHVLAQGKNKPTISGTATATGAIDGTMAGTFDSAGNFTGAGAIQFDFSQDLPLVSGPGSGTPLTGTLVIDASITTLSGTGGSLLAMTAGDDMVKSARFGWDNPSYQKGSTDPTHYSLHFRGNAVLDGVTEMSRLNVSCTAGDANGCQAWTLAPCLVADNAPCTANDVSDFADPAPPNGIGQLVGSFPRGVGNRDIARHVMNWTMSLSR